MPITQALRAAIIDCLESHQGIEELSGRQALIAQAGLDAELAKRITYGGPVRSFCSLLVSDLEEYGRLEDGYHPLQAIIDAVRESADDDGQRECDLILADIRLQLTFSGLGELIRTRWYVLLGGVALGAILLAAVGYALPVAGQPVLGSTTPDTLDAMVVETPMATPIQVLRARSSTQTDSAPTSSARPISTVTMAPNMEPPMVIAHSGRPAALPTMTWFSTQTPLPSATVTASEPPTTHTPTAKVNAVAAALRPATPTTLPTRRPKPSAAVSALPRPTRTPLKAMPVHEGLDRTIKVDAPAEAFRDIRGNITLNGLAIQCLDADSAPIVDEHRFPRLVPLEGLEGVYSLPEGTKKVLLWVDSKVYGDWWNFYSTQAEVLDQESVVLRVVARSSANPEKGLPDRRGKTPASQASDR